MSVSFVHESVSFSPLVSHDDRIMSWFCLSIWKGKRWLLRFESVDRNTFDWHCLNSVLLGRQVCIPYNHYYDHESRTFSDEMSENGFGQVFHLIDWLKKPSVDNIKFHFFLKHCFTGRLNWRSYWDLRWTDCCWWKTRLVHNVDAGVAYVDDGTGWQSAKERQNCNKEDKPYN